MKIFRHQKGFTLIELLVVIGIIAIIAMLGVGNLVTSQKRARNTKRIADLTSIGKALEQVYSPTAGYLTSIYPSIGTVIQNVPRDPNGTNYTINSPTPATAGYCVIAALEEPFDDANCSACDCATEASNCRLDTTGDLKSYCVTNQQ